MQLWITVHFIDHIFYVMITTMKNTFNSAESAETFFCTKVSYFGINNLN